MSKNDELINEIINSSLFEIKRDGSIFSYIALNGRISKNKRLLGNKKSDGYIRFRYKYEFILVHRVIYRKFVGRLIEGMEINHKDGDKSKNEVDNLEQVSKSENCKHAYRTGLKEITRNFGANNGQYKHGLYCI